MTLDELLLALVRLKDEGALGTEEVVLDTCCDSNPLHGLVLGVGRLELQGYDQP